MNADYSIFIHLVTYNDQSTIAQTLQAVLEQEGVNSFIRVTDNASTDNTCQIIASQFADRVELVRSEVNLGFSAGQNSALADFLESDEEFFLALNPDLRLEQSALGTLARSLREHPTFSAACPKLLRADENLNPIAPARLDAAGMEMKRSLRHFDRGSEQRDTGQLNESEEVFGASGACLLMNKGFIEQLSFRATRDEDIFKVHPDLERGSEMRLQLFDEAFFAYREDADLAWRAQLLGHRYWYCAEAIGYHQRLVLPERRSELPAFVNSLGVRNRFLLQLNNYSPLANPEAILEGMLFRNLLVLFAVFLKERASLPALFEVFTLARRAFCRRKWIYSRAKNRSVMKKWF